MFLQKTFALTHRALRVESRQLLPHLMRAGLALVVLFWCIAMGLSFAPQAPGRAVFLNIVIVNSVFASFAVPLIFANAITEEKEERTLALLTVADVSGLTLVSGKAIPRFVSVLLILLVQIPFAMLAVTLGGVTLTQILACYLAIIAYVIFLGCFALLCSVIFRKTGNAAGMAGLFVLLYHLLPGILFLVFSLISMNPNLAPIAQFGNKLLGYHWLTNVFFQLPSILSAGSEQPLFSWQVIANLSAGTIFFVLSVVTFGYFNREVDAAPIQRRGSRRKRTSTSKRGRPWTWALAWKDFTYNAGGMRMQILKFIGYGCLLLLIGGLQSDWTWQQMSPSFVVGIFLYILTMISSLEIALLASHLFHREVRDKTISALVLLPNPFWKTVYAKIGGSLLAITPILFWYVIACCLVPQDVATAIKGAISEMPLTGVIILNAVAQLLLYLHLVAFLSLSIDSWWALFLAGVVQYFGIIIPGSMIQIGMLYLGFIPSLNTGIFLAFLAAVTTFGITTALHVYIGESLKQRAADS